MSKVLKELYQLNKVCYCSTLALGVPRRLFAAQSQIDKQYTNKFKRMNNTKNKREKREKRECLFFFCLLV